MQLLYWRHPEIRMGVELLIKPGRSAFVDSHTKKIGPCIAINRPVRFLMTVRAGTSFESPGPSHACNYVPLRIKKASPSKAYCYLKEQYTGFDLPASGDPIAPEKDIEVVY
jgi:hypothetical protein